MFAAGRAAAFLVPYRQKRARRFRAKANITCSMQQTINLGQVVQPSVLSSVGSIVKNWRQQVKSWVSAHREQLECYVGGPLIVVFCAALIYVAAVLQGGAQ